MRSARSSDKPKYPKGWHQLSQGKLACKELERALVPIIERVFGYYLVKLGSLSSEVKLNKCAVKHQFTCSPQINAEPDFCAQSHKLPLQNNSVDAFIVIGELDFAQDPHQILREIDRAITSDGRLIIAGFNPLSIAGLLKYLPINRKNLLHQGRFFSPARIKDWLSLLEFEVVRQDHLLYSSLFMRRRLNSQSKVQRLFQRYLPWLSSMYIIEARKREVPLCIIKPPWKLKPKFSTNAASARSAAFQSEDV